jgi:FkbM family methyltransferase
MQSIIDLLKQKNINDFTFIDVGAKGTLEYINAFESITRIHAFEPNPEACKQLQLRYQSSAFKKLVINELGLYSSSGSLNFNVSNNAESSSLLSRDVENYKNHYCAFPDFTSWEKGMTTKKAVNINTLTLDTYGEKTINGIDYLKIDTEGTELEVLKGAKHLLTACKIQLIKVEVSTVAIYKNQAMFSDIDLFLRSQNYELIDFIAIPLDTYGLNNAKTNNRHSAPCGDALYLLKDKTIDNIQRIKNAVILHWLGYRGLASYHFSQTDLTNEEIQTIFKLKTVLYKPFILRLLKNITPPFLFNFWRKVSSP